MSTVTDDTIDSLDGVPSSRKPKSVASTGLGQKLLVTPLPSYSGPYSVGYMEVEVAVRVPRSFSHIRRDHKPLLSLETVLFSLYYPCCSDLRKASFLEAFRKSSNPTWLPHPRFEVGKSYARFAGFRKWPTVAFLAGTTMSTKLPAYRNAILADHFASDQDSEEAGPEMPVFPLMIFSHGLGGTRTTYSSMCGEFASHGFVVCALEHRDGSGPSTFVNSPSEKTQDAPGMGEGKDKSDRTNSRRLDYVFPKGNADDTRPSNERGIDAELRTAQTELRLAEIEEAYFVLSMIQKGEGKYIADKNLRRSGNIGSSSQGLDEVDWPLWTGRLHLEQVTIAGHSFGGATTVEVLRHTDRFQFVGQGIIYDIWGAAIQPPEEERRNRIQRPFLCINSEAFMYWSSNFKAVFTLCEEAKANGALSWLMTVRGTVHLSLSDFPVLYPRIFSLLYKATANSHRAILLHVNASIEFLRLIMPQNTSAISPRTNEELLNMALLKDLPDERKPTNEKWIAMRLRIPHEMALRLKPRVIRRHTNRKHARQAGTVIPTDPTGKEIYALQDLGVGEEVWMHFAPSKDELASLGSDPGKGLGIDPARSNTNDGRVSIDNKETHNSTKHAP